VLGEPLETPKRAKHFETFNDAEHQSEDSQLTKDAREMTLDAFLSKYTSEDDASFSRLVEKEVTAARKAYQHAYEHANRVQTQMANSGRLVGWKNHDPSHASVMSFPAGIPRTFTPEEMKSSDKAVIPENTRFPEGGPSWNRANSSSDSSSAASSSSASTFREPLPITSATGNLDAQLYQALLEERRGNAIFENVNTDSSVAGYAFVATPQVNPGNVDQSPLITWGEVHEPVALDEIDSLTKVGAAVAPASSGTGFTVPAISKTSLATASLVKKTISKRTPKITANSPLVRSGLTPDLQLRSSYSPVIRSHGKRSVTATPSRPGSQANTPALR
jgi:protein DGCR14